MELTPDARTHDDTPETPPQTPHTLEGPYCLISTHTLTNIMKLAPISTPSIHGLHSLLPYTQNSKRIKPASAYISSYCIIIIGACLHQYISKMAVSTITSVNQTTASS